MKPVYGLFAAVVLLTSACQSKEEKAAELIKSELSKTLYDFASYDPIETKVTEAFASAYNDSACWHQAAMVAYGLQTVQEHLEKAQDAKEHMEIWGAPNYYSSNYSDRQYYKYREIAQENIEQAQSKYQFTQRLGKKLQDSIAALDSSKIIGWEVSHRFRCKTKGGQATIGDYRYIIDKNFEKVLFREDMDETDNTEIRKIIKSALNGDFQPKAASDSTQVQ